MREHNGPTEPMHTDSGAVRAETHSDDLRVEGHDGKGADHLGAVGTAGRRSDRADRVEGSSSDRPDPVAAAKDPDNRAKLLLATAALSLLNLLLLIAVLASVTGNRVQEEVVVDGAPCVVAQHGDGESALFCQR
jgi:hypothetical protein